MLHTLAYDNSVFAKLEKFLQYISECTAVAGSLF